MTVSRVWAFFARLIGEVIPVILIVTVTVVIAADIVARTGFRRPVLGARDIGLISFIWLVYLGIIGVARADQMMGITYFRNRMGRARKYADALAHLIIMGITSFVVYAAYRQIATARFVMFEQLPLPKWILAVSIVIGMAMLFVISASRFLQALRGPAEGSQSAQEGPRSGGGTPP
jgi:TRAP-type C4-dicarboxylate transport system permease small subunit